MAVNQYVIEVSESDFEQEVIQRSWQTPVVVDFWAPWCGPCRMLGPVLERLAEEGRGSFILAKLNTDENPNLSLRYGIQGIPAVKAFRDGRVVAEFVGAQPEPNVRRFLKQIAPSEGDRVIAEGQHWLRQERWAEAENTFRRALEARPGNARAALGLARALLAQGRGCEADDALAIVSDGAEVAEAEALRPLAQWLCEFGASPQDDPTPIDALYRNAARLARRGNYAAAMDGILDVLRQDKRYRKGEPRKVMLGIFTLLGEEHPLTTDYRRELGSVLF